MKYTVHFRHPMWESREVEAENIVAAIREAEQEGIPGLCHQCAGGGWGARNWSRSGDDDSELTEVTDEDGNTVWSADKDPHPDDNEGTKD